MGRPLRVAFVSHHPHLQMGGQRSMALLIEHLDRRAVEPLAICPGPGPLTDHLTRLGCPVGHVPLHRIKPRTLAAVWRSSRAIRALLRKRDIDIIAPDAARDALTCGLAKLGTGTKMVWFVRLTSDALTPESGVLVPERDPAATAGAWNALLGDPARLATLRAGAIARARASFDVRQHARAVEAFYREVGGGTLG